jgi:uncharacterized protein YukE
MDPQTIDELRQKLQELFDKLQDVDMQAQYERIANMLEDAVGWFDKWGKYVILGPVGGLIYDGLTNDEVEKAVKNWYDVVKPACEDAVVQLGEDLKRVVDSLVGDPKGLKELSWDYADVITKIFPAGATTIPDEVETLGDTWSGPAFKAYSRSAAKQHHAVSALAQAMVDASTLTNNAGQRILQLWADLANQLINYLVDIVKCLSDAETVNEILSMEAGVLTDAIADTLAFAQGIAKTLEDYWISTGFEDALSWRILNNGPGDVLPQNTWPVLHNDWVHDLSHGGGWKG